MTKWNCAWVSSSAIIWVAVWTTGAAAIELFTSDGNGLDAEATETADGPGGPITYGLNGTKVNTNARYNGYNNGLPAGVPEAEGGDTNNDDRNEFWVLRFDLASQEKSQIGNAAIKLTAFRDTDPKDLRIWGVNSGTAGLNTLDEATATFADVPGLIEDDDMTTLSVDGSALTYLGDFLFPQVGGGDPLEGDLLTIDQALIDESGPGGTSEPGGAGVAVQDSLDGYLRSLDSTDMAMFLVGGVASNGQVRVATKEADEQQATTELGEWTCGVDFVCAPSLEFEIVDVEGLPGDYNGDNVVDAADYTVWRDRLGETFSLPNENPDDANPGVVDIDDYHFWKSQYGASAGSASLAAGSVPEPSAAVLAGLLWFAGGFGVVRRSGGRRRCR